MLDTTAAPQVLADYAVVKRVIEFVSSRRREQPSIQQIAESAGQSPLRLEQVFERWAGLTAETFLQAIAVERMLQLLRDSAAALDGAHPAGLNVFATHEALTWGDRRRDDLILRYGFHPSPFGEAIVVAAPHGLAGLGFVGDDREAALGDMLRRWPRALFSEDSGSTAAYAARAFDPSLWRPDAPLRLVMIGSDFDVRV